MLRLAPRRQGWLRAALLLWFTFSVSTTATIAAHVFYSAATLKCPMGNHANS